MTYKTYQTILVFLVSCFLFLVSFAPQGADAHQHMSQSCFTKEECEDSSGIYKGIAEQSADCQDQAKEWVDAGLTYNCYPQQKAYKLQVPFLSPIFRGTTRSLEDYISILYQLLISIAGIIAGIMIVWAGVKWLTAAGSPDRISDARHKIGNALIGIILVLSSYVILQTINPDLVRLRVPPIKMIRQQVLSPWCPNYGPFQGRYKCGVESAVSGIGKCTGAACDSGGCFRWKKPTEEKYDYRCVDKTKCPSSCAEINKISEADGFWALCSTDICKDKIPGLCRGAKEKTSSGFSTKSKPGGCLGRWKDGEPGGVAAFIDFFIGIGCVTNSDCEPGLFCNTAEEPNTCRKKGPGGAQAKALGEGIACNDDIQCAQGLVCNKAYFNKCQDPNKATESASCERDKECAPGLKCVDTTGNNECYDGSSGDPCCNNIECKNGTCSGASGTPSSGQRTCNWAGSCT